MESKTIALIVAVVAGAVWALMFFAGLLASAVQLGPIMLLAALPIGAVAYILVRLIGEQMKGDPYDDIEE